MKEVRPKFSLVTDVHKLATLRLPDEYDSPKLKLGVIREVDETMAKFDAEE